MIINREQIWELAAQGKRLDGRELEEYRSPINVDLNISWTAEGSSRVQIGETVVIAGVKLSIEKPYNDTPDEGGITVNAELTPLSSSEYESGPPGTKSIELARVIDRGIREAKAIDMKNLCIEAGEKAWFVTVDIITINDAGNLFDTSGIAVLAALKTAHYPVVDSNTGAINYKEKTTKTIRLTKEPVSVTVYKINGKFLVDPTIQEEKSAEARLTITSDKKGTISAIQKGGDAPLSLEETDAMIQIALEKATFLREELNKFVK